MKCHIWGVVLQGVVVSLAMRMFRRVRFPYAPPLSNKRKEGIMGFTIVVDGMRPISQLIPMLIITAIGLAVYSFGIAKKNGFTGIGIVIIIVALLFNISAEFIK